MLIYRSGSSLSLSPSLPYMSLFPSSFSVLIEPLVRSSLLLFWLCSNFFLLRYSFFLRFFFCFAVIPSVSNSDANSDV